MQQRKLNLLVPMAGSGKRFKAAGYKTYKPFIQIQGKPMIKYVFDAFPEEVTKYCIVDRSLLSKEEEAYLLAQPNVKLCPIAPHTDGPAFSIKEALPQLPLEESFFISYCDIFWTWDFEKVRKFLDLEGVVFTQRGFHPHLVGNNFSAFCRVKPEQPNQLAEIKEKGSFTSNWMEEPLSVGAFYFKNGNQMAREINKLISKEERVAGEYFPSLLFNGLVEEGHAVGLCDIDFFIHWGVPDQLNDFLRWSTVFQKMGKPGKKLGKSICCMGGLGARMKEVSDTPKALLDLCGKPMYQTVTEEFNCQENFAITTDPLVKELQNGRSFDSIYSVGAATRSQMETLQKAVSYLTTRESFFLTSCDAFGIFDSEALQTFVRKEQPEALIFTFKPSLLNGKSTGHHTFVSTANGRITDVHIKSKSSEEDRGLAGFFWFKEGSVFNELKNTPPDAKYEMCIDHFLKYLVKSGRKVLEFPLEQYVHVGTPDEYLEFQYWWKHKEVVLPNSSLKLSIVLPCYNEAKNLPDLMAGYRAAMGDRTGVEVILVDNGSLDNTAEVLKTELAKPENYAFRTVKVETNLGYGHGILTGLNAARGKFLAWSHADHQCPPTDVFRTLEAMEKTGVPEECLGKGFRTNDRGEAAKLTRLQNRLASWVLGTPMEEISAQPKVFHRSFFQSFRKPPKGFELESYVYYKAVRERLRIVLTDVHFLERRHGTSSWASSSVSRLKAMAKSFLYLVFLRVNRNSL